MCPPLRRESTLSLLSYECRATLPCFAIEYPSDWLLDTSRAKPNQGAIELSSEDLGGVVTIEWGPALSPQGELENASQRYSRHEVVQQQRVSFEGIAWSEVVYHGWKDARTPQPDRLCARFTQRAGMIWRVAYRLNGAAGARRRPAAEGILKRFHFLKGVDAHEAHWRHHRYMASVQEFAFNHPSDWNVVPEVSGETGACTVTPPAGGSFQVSWGRPQTMAEFMQKERLDFREFTPLLERPGLVLRSGTWDELVFDGTRVSGDAWSEERPKKVRGRYRFGMAGGMAWVIGYRLPHEQLAEVSPSFDRMLASMRILGTQELAHLPEMPEGRGLQLELGMELALCTSLRQNLEPVAFGDRLAQELHLLRVLMAYEGLLVPHLTIVQSPDAPVFGWRLRAGSQNLVERDLGKGGLDPLVQVLEGMRNETPRLDGLLTPRLARPELVQQLFPRSPHAYERLRALRPELNLPATAESR
ncbi:hypothetical protein D3C86_265730 [compost metagenome]